ncbi:hypothetical protein GCM10009827_107640 [Dactylosporangium maewongense]|uniref:Uncharacterized protein n=1 Tax=Dactylosporangium maewongense TaxID=634393 RepID=A0ABP4NXW2_9ACTN
MARGACGVVGQVRAGSWTSAAPAAVAAGFVGQVGGVSDRIRWSCVVPNEAASAGVPSAGEPPGGVGLEGPVVVLAGSVAGGAAGLDARPCWSAGSGAHPCCSLMI